MKVTASFRDSNKWFIIFWGKHIGKEASFITLASRFIKLIQKAYRVKGMEPAFAGESPFHESSSNILGGTSQSFHRDNL